MYDINATTKHVSLSLGTAVLSVHNRSDIISLECPLDNSMHTLDSPKSVLNGTCTVFRYKLLFVYFQPTVDTLVT